MVTYIFNTVYQHKKKVPFLLSVPLKKIFPSMTRSQKEFP